MRYFLGFLTAAAASIFSLFPHTALADQVRYRFGSLQCESVTPFTFRFPPNMNLSRLVLINQASIRSSFQGNNVTGDGFTADSTAHIWMDIDLGGGLHLSIAPGNFTNQFANAEEGGFQLTESRRFMDTSQAGGIDQIAETGVEYPATLHVDCSSSSQGVGNAQISIGTSVNGVLITVRDAR